MAAYPSEFTTISTTGIGEIQTGSMPSSDVDTTSTSDTTTQYPTTDSSTSSESETRTSIPFSGSPIVTSTQGIYPSSSVSTIPRMTSASSYPTPSRPVSTAKADKSSLSPSAAAGVGIGATLAVVLFILAGWMLVRRRRSKKLLSGPAYRRRQSCPPIALGSMCPKLRSSKARAVELDASGQTHELPAVRPVHSKDISPLIELE